MNRSFSMAMALWVAYLPLLGAVIEDSKLDLDNECLADSASSECSVNAMQRRAIKKHEAQQEPTAEAWTQCGGHDWTGPTACEQGYACEAKNDYYAQCKPDGSPTLPPKPTKPPPPTVPPHMASLPERSPLPKPKEFSAPLNPIIVKGNFLYDSATGKRFFAKGTSYNPRNDVFTGKSSECVPGKPGKYLGYTADVIADDLEERWTEDLQVIADMGANTIRLFNLEANKDHSKFMKKAASLGIYVIVPLNSKDFGFLPAFPAPDCYTRNLTHMVKGPDGTEHEYGNVGINVLSYGKQIVKEFSKYSNTLLFTVNNEFAMNDKNGFAGFQCVKALTRDIHRYQASCEGNMRRVPLIYSDYDMGPPDRKLIASYLTCALESPDDAIDAYGLNVYSWCDDTYPDDTGKDNFEWSPYKHIRDDFKSLSVPMLFTEFGCTEGKFMTQCPYKGGRTWSDIPHMVGKEMGEIVSGAIAYTYSMDFEERGLVMTPGYVLGQNKVYPLDNYYALQKVFREYDVSSKFDGAVASDCHWTPGEVSPMSFARAKSVCPSADLYEDLQRRRGTSKITDWKKLPPTPHAPLSAMGQSECPAYEVPEMQLKESCCHMKCGMAKNK